MQKKNNVSKAQFIIDILVVFLYLFYMLAYCNSFLYNLLSKFSGTVLFFVYLFIFFILNNNKENKRNFLYVSIILLIISIGMIFTEPGFGSFLNIMNMFLFLLSVDKIRLSKVTMKIIRFITPFLYIMFIISNHGFLNTNYVGYIFLLYFMLFNNLYNLSDKKVFKLLINIVLVLITLYYGNLYQCRTSQIITIFIFIVQHFNKKVYKTDSLRKMLPYVLSVGSLVTAFMYVYMWKNDITVDLTSFASKRLFSGRNMIWNECFELIKAHPLFGVGGKHIISSHFTYALHNSMLMVITTYGIPIFIMFVYCMKRLVDSLYEKYSDKKNFYLIIVSLFSIFFVDYFESYFYWSVFNFISLVIISSGIYKVEEETYEK